MRLDVWIGLVVFLVRPENKIMHLIVLDRAACKQLWLFPNYPLCARDILSFVLAAPCSFCYWSALWELRICPSAGVSIFLFVLPQRWSRPVRNVVGILFCASVVVSLESCLFLGACGLFVSAP